MMQREFSDEVFPDDAGYEGDRTQDIFQGGENSCTCMGGTNSIESYVHAYEEQQGTPLADSLQLSPAFPWRILKRLPKISVESMISVLNTAGACQEKFYPYKVEPLYPYYVTTLNQDPSSEAWTDANSRIINARTQRIAGKWEMVRALALGYRLITCRVGGNLEHIEAGIRYNKDQGIRIHGSGGARFWEPWSSFEMGGNMSQVYSIECDLAPRIVHPDYRAPTPASFKDGVLTIPYLTLMPEYWQDPIQYFKNVKVHFGSDIGFDNVRWDNPDVTHMDCRWKPANSTYGTPHVLSLFAVELGGTVFKQVTVRGVVPSIVSYEVIQ